MINKSLQESDDQHTTVQKNLSVHFCYFVRKFSCVVFDHVAEFQTGGWFVKVSFKSRWKIILRLYLQNVMLPFFTWFKSSLFVVLDKVHVIRSWIINFMMQAHHKCLYLSSFGCFLLLCECKARFRRRTFYEPNLIWIKADPNYLDRLNWFRRRS